MALYDAAQILVSDWNGMMERIKQNGVGGLLPYTG